MPGQTCCQRRCSPRGSQACRRSRERKRNPADPRGRLILYYPQEVADALKAYVSERKEIKVADKVDENALFLSLQKKRISQRAVQLMVKKYCSVAVPLKKKMSPHKLRSTYATRLYHETEDIYLVADALGHADVNTTRRHYAAMSDERRRQAAQNVHLPSAKTESPENK